MITPERYDRIRKVLENKILSLAEKYNFNSRSFANFADIAWNLLGPKVSNPSIIRDYFDNHSDYAKDGIRGLWALRQYLNLIDNFPSYREGEIRNNNPDLNRPHSIAFEDISKQAGLDSPGKTHIYYVQKSAERLKNLKSP